MFGQNLNAIRQIIFCFFFLSRMVNYMHGSRGGFGGSVPPFLLENSKIQNFKILIVNVTWLKICLGLLPHILEKKFLSKHPWEHFLHPILNTKIFCLSKIWKSLFEIRARYNYNNSLSCKQMSSIVFCLHLVCHEFLCRRFSDFLHIICKQNHDKSFFLHNKYFWALYIPCNLIFLIQFLANNYKCLCKLFKTLKI